MLVNNLAPRVIYVGGITLIPGINKLTDTDVSRLKTGRYWSSIEKLASKGGLEIIESDRPKVEQVAVTYDEHLLLSWHEKAKGKLRKAIEDQLDKVKIETEEKE